MVARTNRLRSILSATGLLGLGLLAIALLLAGGAPGARAAAINVNQFGDTAPDGCDFAGCTLREAIIQANANAGADTIQLDAGTYTIALFGFENAAALGDLDINADLTITGEGPGVTIIDADNMDRVFDVGPTISDIFVTISDLTVRDGLVAPYDGGGVLNNGDLTLRNVHVFRNFAGEGGGVFNNGEIEIIDSTIERNSAEFGGGLNNNDLATLTNTAVIDNDSDQAGGGIRNDSGILGITGGSITDNRAGTTGGGIDSRDRAIIEQTDITDNAAETYGGGVWNDDWMDLIDTTVDDNEAEITGGGVHNSGDLDIDRTTISNNRAISGGGMENAPSGNIDALNTTISGNEALLEGGGIYNDAGDLLLTNVTIAKNVADADDDGSGGGGGITADGGSNEVEMLLLGDNIDMGGEIPDCNASLDSLGHNLIENTAGCTITGDDAGNILGPDPKLGPLGNNGGYTKTHALLPQSPGIDSESHECPPPSIDQRGFSRAADGNNNGIFTCDIGAYEYLGEPPVTATPSPTPAPSATPTPTASPTPSPSPTATPVPTASPTPAPEVLQGDVQCDDDVDSVDQLGVLRYVGGFGPLAQEEPCPDVGTPHEGHPFGDVLCNDTVDSVDALAIGRFIAGLSALQQAEPCTDIGT